ncbi:PP2C family protein-serine/threonine phosphatase [Streptomyces sp. NPDC090082]|uniref:PP2C family protein-serine/threonine phosphatase n=1 Tax=unclassified Streptomyces TaxID=2593676 RepID=UPI0038128B76
MTDSPRGERTGPPPGSRAAAGRRPARALPALFLVTGVVFQLSTPEALTGAPLFVSAPLVSAPLFTWWATVLFGALGFAATAVLYAVTTSMGDTASLHGLATELATLVLVTAIAVLLNHIVRRDREAADSARGVAEAAQKAVLPTPDPRVGGLRLGARYEAARKDTLIGGDLYAARATPYGVRIVMGDVRGKGLGAIETVSVILGAFWEAAENEPSLTEVARCLERSLTREGASRTGLDDAESFATCVLVEIPPGHEVLRVLNKGHPEPLLLHPDGTVTVLTPGEFSLPLGLGDLAPEPDRADVWDFPADATLLLYTDGLSEARDGTDVFFDPASWLAGRASASPDRLLGALVGDVRRFTGGARSDDMALLAVRRPAPGPARG